MKKMLFIFGIALFLTAGTQAAVLIQDGFDDGGRTDGVDALDVDWWKVYSYTLSVNTAGGLGSGNALSVFNSGTGGSIFLANFPNQVLDSEGDRITFSFDVQLVQFVNNNIRFGLLDSGGTLVSADVTVDDLADNDSGYFFRLGTGTDTANTKIYEDQGTSSPLGGGDLVARTSGVFSIGDTNVHSIKMSYTYSGGRIYVDFVLDEGTAGEQAVSWSDGSTLKQNYNEAAVAINGGQDALIDNILVEYEEVSDFEPVVDAGSDQVIFLGDSLQLASSSEDPEGLPLTYLWTPTGPGTATFDPDETTENPIVSFDTAGTYTLELAAFDGVMTGTDSLTVVVRDPAEKALLALWDFETTTPADPNVFDAVGDNDAAWTVNDPNYTDGWITGAVPDIAAQFFGDMYIEAQIDPMATPSLNDDLQYGLTVACWVRVDNAESFDTVRLIKKDGWGLSSSASSPGSVKFNLSGQPGDGINARTSVADGYWHHVAGVYDGQSEAIYIDGILEASRASNGFLSANTAVVTIGAENDGSMVFTDAALDDVRVYNYGLDVAEILGLALMGDNLVPHVTVEASTASINLASEDTISLTGTALDMDGDSMDYAWSTASGPAAVTFSAGTSLVTDATFTAGGIYTLRLSVDDGTTVISSDVSVLVYPADWNGELAYMPYDVDPDDASFWGHTATVYGNPTYPAGQMGSGAIEFDGVDDYLEYDASLASDVTDLTFCAWVRANAAADMSIAGNYPNYDGEEQGWWLWFDDAGYFKLWMGEKNAIYKAFNMTNATYTVGQWVHVTMTFKYNETEANEVKFYVNGQIKLDSTTSYRVFPNPTIPFTVGRRPASTSYAYLNGAVDDLYLFGRVLESAEIGELAGLNIPPIVNAGKNAKIILPTDSVSLVGTVTDTDATTAMWSVVEGAAGVSFAPDDNESTTVTFPEVGDYLLRLTATDSFNASNSDDVVVKVRAVGFDGLEAHITFENSDPNLAVDSTVGIGYDGTLYGDPNVGPAASNAQVGAGALELFNDAKTKTDYVEYSKFLGSDAAMSVSVWFNCKDIAAGGRVIEKWPGGTSGDGWFLRIRGGDGNGNLAAMVGSAFGNGVDMRAPLGTFQQGQWVHAVLTFEDGVMRLWQNGALVNEMTEVSYSPADDVTPLLIGRRLTTDTEWFNGLIDEVRVYDYALSIEEVKSLYAGDGGLPWDTCPTGSTWLTGDYTDDCKVDIKDVAELGSDWMNIYTIADLIQVANDWLDCDNYDLSECF